MADYRDRANHAAVIFSKLPSLLNFSQQFKHFAHIRQAPAWMHFPYIYSAY